MQSSTTDSDLASWLITADLGFPTFPRVKGLPHIYVEINQRGDLPPEAVYWGTQDWWQLSIVRYQDRSMLVKVYVGRDFDPRHSYTFAPVQYPGTARSTIRVIDQVYLDHLTEYGLYKNATVRQRAVTLGPISVLHAMLEASTKEGHV